VSIQVCGGDSIVALPMVVSMELLRNGLTGVFARPVKIVGIALPVLAVSMQLRAGWGIVTNP
jgi:hypothetical protein